MTENQRQRKLHLLLVLNLKSLIIIPPPPISPSEKYPTSRSLRSSSSASRNALPVHQHLSDRPKRYAALPCSPHTTALHLKANLPFLRPAGMSLPLPKPLHGSIRPGLKVLRRADHEGTCVNGSARCAGWVGAFVSFKGWTGRKGEMSTGHWMRGSHCSIGTSSKASSNYQSPRHHLLLCRAVHRRGFDGVCSRLGTSERDTLAARRGYRS
jgi:hypothetical protein